MTARACLTRLIPLAIPSRLVLGEQAEETGRTAALFRTALQILGERVAFGAGRVGGIGRDVVALAGPGARVLLVTDPGVVAAGLAEPVEAALAGAGHSATLFDDVRSDPLSSQIDAAAEAARQEGAQVIVALGGGSAMDVAKMAAGAAAGERPAETYAQESDPFGGAVLPVIAIPTTAGTGAEMTQSMVFTTADGRKVWTDAAASRPALALLDPELSVRLPANLTAATGVDALVHAMESITSRRSKAETHAPAREAIRLVRAHLPTAVSEPGNLEARGGMLLAACLAGLAIDSGGTAIAHALGHALGAVGHIHHGRAVGLSLRAALPGNAAAWPKEHAAVARAFGLEGEDEAALAAELPGVFDAFLRQVGLEIGLAGDGLGPDDVERLVAETQKPENRPMLQSNSRALDEAGLRDLVREVLS
jgi:alcohol dehydrogenase class IV